MSLNRNSNASDRNYNKKISNCVSAEIQLPLTETIRRKIHIASWPKFNFISSKLFQDIFELCPSRKSIASYRNYSKTFPWCVWAEIQLHLIEIILGRFQIVFEPNFNCISSKFFSDNSILRLSRNSIPSDVIYSETIPKCVLVEIHLHLL